MSDRAHVLWKCSICQRDHLWCWPECDEGVIEMRCQGCDSFTEVYLIETSSGIFQAQQPGVRLVEVG